MLNSYSVQFSSVQSLSRVRPFATPWIAGCQPSPSITNPGAHPHSCPLSQWCHPTIWSSVIPFSSCPQSFPASGSFQMSQLSASGGQSIEASASVNIQDWSSLGWTGWISCGPRDTRESSPTPQLKSINSSVLSLLYGPGHTIIRDYWKNHNFDY